MTTKKRNHSGKEILSSRNLNNFTVPQLSREKRQRRQDSLTLNAAANCNFGSGLGVGTCEWGNLENVTSPGLKWTASKGDDAFWIGGPRHDHDDHNSLEGGYVFLETSSLSEGEAGGGRESALIESPLLTTTGSKVDRPDS